jgi:alcohol dehydrogenase (cytochrome c)
MKTMQTLLAVCSVVPIALLAQGPGPSSLGKYPEAWPTHYGDYSGRRYSPLTQINTTNVKTLSLAWIHRIATSFRGRPSIGASMRTAGDSLYGFTVAR